MKSYSESYKKAGVDVTAGYRAVDLMKKHIARTMTDNVLTGIGGFGGNIALLKVQHFSTGQAYRLHMSPPLWQQRPNIRRFKT